MVYVAIVLAELKKRIQRAPNGEARDALKTFEDWLEHFMMDDLEKMQKYIETEKQQKKKKEKEKENN